MNLITEKWLTLLDQSGQHHCVSVADIFKDDWADIVMPRQDFYGASWQFLIGLLQTAFPPNDLEEWVEWYESPPTADQLSTAFAKISHAFELFGEGPRFMQDLDLLEGASEVDVSSLLIDAPGGNALKMNTDHFIKRGQVQRLSPSMAAMALFTLQINAPSGGQGHRTGLRGGGPLTTLVTTNDKKLSLFRKLWLNVIPLENNYELPKRWDDGSVFPWLAPTRTSEQKGLEVYLHDEQVHPFQQLWAMPRRIRLLEGQGGECDLTGEQAVLCVESYRTKNYGINYDGTWKHPLTPYRYDPKNPGSIRTSIKGQPSGLGYRQWHQFLYPNREEGTVPALAVEQFAEKKQILDEIDEQQSLRVWVFGFDMDNMKARSWQESVAPYVAIPPDKVERFMAEIVQHVDVARSMCSYLRRGCKNAWFGDGDSKGDFGFIDDQFWTETEPAFVQLLESLKDGIADGRERLSSEHCSKWVRSLKYTAIRIFDTRVLGNDSADPQLKRKLDARRRLVYAPVKSGYLQRHELNAKGEIA